MPEPKIAPAESGFAQVDGGRLWYEVAGTGPPLVLIHSGITDSRSWDPQMGPLRESHRVLRYDMRGFGKSDVTHGKFSNVTDLVRLLDAIGIDRATLMGVSMGGALAVDMGLTNPRRVDALVLVAAGFSGRQPSEAFKKLMTAWEAAYQVGGVDAAADLALEIWLYGAERTAADVNPVVREAVRRMYVNVAERYPEDAAPEGIDPPAVGRLGEIRVPTLVLVGDLDLPDMLQAADLLQAGIPGARRADMTGVAHVPNMEQPDAFNRIVLDFLASISTQPDR